ncbi:amino acid adenylation domain-containing protein, partial [Flavobacterium sp. H122]|uniref:non-ribosomal peptide synthetase n=1 Tax=Flavobacterium sp. H122 TaxID=2529860 RepID=UPI0010AA11B2
VYPSDVTVLDLFEKKVQENPDTIALVYEDLEISYADFNKSANQFSDYLKKEFGVGANDLVGVQMDRSEKMLITIFGILKSGGAYVPLDVNYPQDRTEFIIKDGGLKLCVNDELFEGFKTNQTSYNESNVSLENHLENLAYCIYTSGSTGNPKGVLNHHAGLYNRLVWMRDYLGVNNNEVFLQKTPYTFDVSVWELVLPFMIGSKLVILRPEGHKDSFYMEQVIEKEKVSVVHFVPSMLGIYLQTANHDTCQSLKHIVCSGEELPVETVKSCKLSYPQTRIHNLYGPTEAAIDVTAIDLTEVDVEKEGVSIGKPIANTRIYIVDENLQLQPLGVQGELLISGVQVARGYLNLPELTQNRFIPDPFREGYQVYRTGDIAQWNLDGTIKYIGRIDNQVKIRGNRIELGEIENTLLKYTSVTHATAVAQEVNGQKVLVAYYVTDSAVDKSELRTYLTEKLVEYMVPTYYVELAVMPLTTSGKIDRKVLPLVSTSDVIQKDYVGAESDIEAQLVAVWEDILSISPIGV